MGETPPQDHAGGSARCILDRDVAGKLEQDPAGTRVPARQPAAARDARDDFLGAVAGAPACDGRLSGGDAKINAEAQSRVPWAEGTAGQIAQSKISSGHRHAERSDPGAARRAV